MYLISLYFDEKTNNCIRRYIMQAAQVSGNHFMLEANVPPHITLSAFEARHIEEIKEALDQQIAQMHTGIIQWAAVGQFFPRVLFLLPVLNQYLHTLQEVVFEVLKNREDVMISPYYQPFQWMPHATIAKKMTWQEMELAIRALAKSFGMFEGSVVRIGLARPSPYTDIASWDLIV